MERETHPHRLRERLFQAPVPSKGFLHRVVVGLRANGGELRGREDVAEGGEHLLRGREATVPVASASLAGRGDVDTAHRVRFGREDDEIALVRDVEVEVGGVGERRAVRRAREEGLASLGSVDDHLVVGEEATREHAARCIRRLTSARFLSGMNRIFKQSSRSCGGRSVNKKANLRALVVALGTPSLHVHRPTKPRGIRRAQRLARAHRGVGRVRHLRPARSERPAERARRSGAHGASRGARLAWDVASTSKTLRLLCETRRTATECRRFPSARPRRLLVL